jgi:hypothetical protein
MFCGTAVGITPRRFWGDIWGDIAGDAAHPACTAAGRTVSQCCGCALSGVAQTGSEVRAEAKATPCARLMPEDVFLTARCLGEGVSKAMRFTTSWRRSRVGPHRQHRKDFGCTSFSAGTIGPLLLVLSKEDGQSGARANQSLRMRGLCFAGVNKVAFIDSSYGRAIRSQDTGAKGVRPGGRSWGLDCVWRP